MAASANHIVYEGIIINARNIDGRLTLFVANTKEEPRESDVTVRVKLDRKECSLFGELDLRRRKT